MTDFRLGHLRHEPGDIDVDRPLMSIRLLRDGRLEYRSQMHPAEVIEALGQLVAQMKADLPQLAEVFEAAAREADHPVTNGYQH